MTPKAEKCPCGTHTKAACDFAGVCGQRTVDAQAADVGELPPLPKPNEPTFFIDGGLFTAAQMAERDAMWAARLASQATTEEELDALLLPIEGLLAQYHSEVWEAAAAENGGTDYDMAGRSTAKAIVAALRDALKGKKP